MRRFHEVLLLALLLVAVQTAILTHEHEFSAAPAGATAAQSCEFCTGHHPAAPAAEAGSASLPDLQSTRIPDPRVVAALPARTRAAHRSRAPPTFRSA